jgi:peptide deformylase
MIKIIQVPDKRLFQISEGVEIADITGKYIQSIIGELKFVMATNKLTAGLAAVQLGYLKRIFVFRSQDLKVITVINPVLEVKQGPQVDMDEGCLSYPISVIAPIKVPRYPECRIEYLNEDGEPCGFAAYIEDNAQVIQHEYDHLNGIILGGKCAAVEKSSIIH